MGESLSGFNRSPPCQTHPVDRAQTHFHVQVHKLYKEPCDAKAGRLLTVGAKDETENRSCREVKCQQPSSLNDRASAHRPPWLEGGKSRSWPSWPSSSYFFFLFLTSYFLSCVLCIARHIFGYIRERAHNGTGSNLYNRLTLDMVI
jgi:hypothetical protein